MWSPLSDAHRRYKVLGLVSGFKGLVSGWEGTFPAGWENVTIGMVSGCFSRPLGSLYLGHKDNFFFFDGRCMQ